MDLKTFFEQNNRAAIAFSGGTDSVYLLYAAKKYGAQVCAYYVKSVFQPEFEYEDGRKICEQLKIPMKVIELNILAHQEIKENPANRCYYCKRNIFGAIKEAAAKDGFSVLLDGTNASDAEDDRPGMRAIKELQVMSPLRLCGITKEQVRSRSKEAGLFTWEKPSYACLATRIPTGERITEEMLTAVEAAEQSLKQMGFVNFRLRLRKNAHGILNCGLLQVEKRQLEKAKCEWEKICLMVGPYFESISLDEENFRTVSD